MYLLDTNICIYLIKRKSEALLKRIEEAAAYSIIISSITLGELEYGIAKSLYPEQNRTALIEFLSSFEIIPFTDTDAQVFGSIRAFLHKKGMPIGLYNLQIAAQCITRDLILITHNVREFSRIPGIKIENWHENHYE